MYVVYLTGIGVLSADGLAFREVGFLRRLAERLPQAAVIHDVFPYPDHNIPAPLKKFFVWGWRALDRRRARLPALLFKVLINTRNLFQVFFSASVVFGPAYNRALAREILAALIRHGYPVGAGRPVVLVELSGGVQVAIGAAPTLRRALGAPIRIISLGGLFNGAPGLDHVDRLYHLVGSGDTYHRLPQWGYPSRWPLAVWSPWNRAQREGRAVVVDLGPIEHFGATGYFAPESRLPDGATHLERTVETVARLITAG